MAKSKVPAVYFYVETRRCRNACNVNKHGGSSLFYTQGYASKNTPDHCSFKHMPIFKQVLEYHCPSLNFNGTLGLCSRTNLYWCSLYTWDGLAYDFFALLDQGLLPYKLISILVCLNISNTYTKINLIFCQYSTSLVSWHPGNKPLIFPMIWLTNLVLEGTGS